jgi:hypothetical protein
MSCNNLNAIATSPVKPPQPQLPRSKSIQINLNARMYFFINFSAMMFSPFTFRFSPCEDVGKTIQIHN